MRERGGELEKEGGRKRGIERGEEKEKKRKRGEQR